MSLAAGGHLTHGARPNLSGKWFNAVAYGVRRDDGRIDFDEVEQLASQHRPKLIIAGGSAYSRIIDFARFRAIADEVGAFLMVDMAHFAGLVAGGVYPIPCRTPMSSLPQRTRPCAGRGAGWSSPTTRKSASRSTLPCFRAAGRAADACHCRQGGRIGRGLQPAFKAYAEAVVENAEVLAATLVEGGLEIVSGGTDSHLMLVDLRPLKLTGRDAEASLGRAGITCNKNGIPFDPQGPTVTSGIRLGSPAATTRGFGPQEFRAVGRHIVEVLRALGRVPADNGATEAAYTKKFASSVRGFRFTAARARRDRQPIIGRRTCAVRFAEPTTPRSRISRPTDDRGAIRRRRFCPNCAARFTTFERVQLRELTVIKKHGQREPFDRDKLARSIYIALRKRPVEPERVERIINSLVRQLESSGETDIPSDMIGGLVMEALSSLDQVAYIRFASVYRNFREAKDFGDFVGRIAADGD